MKIFTETGIMSQSAFFGWENKDDALYGLREGYKNSADELVETVLKYGSDVKKLDTFIFPIIFSYRHSIELSLKHIYLRAFGRLPLGGHNLISLWDVVNKDIVEKMILSESFVEKVKNYKKRFFKYSLDDISLSNLRLLIKELQKANQQNEEVIKNNKQVDDNAEVWRYLMSTDGELFFKCSHSVDYVCLRESMNYIYHIIDEYLSS